MGETNWLDLLWGLVQAISPQEAEARVVAKDPRSKELIDDLRSEVVMPSDQEPDPMMSGRYDPIRQDIYQNVLAAAEARPEVVGVSRTKQMPAGDEYTSGMYNTRTDEITLKAFDPFYSSKNRYTDIVPTSVHYQDTLSHELVHFLLSKIAPEMHWRGPTPDFLQRFSWLDTPTQQLAYGAMISKLLGSAEGQHDFIRFLQGSDRGPLIPGPTGQLQPDLRIYPEQQPFRPLPPSMTKVERDVYAETLRRILLDPTLFHRALGSIYKSLP